jgi:hypothetical protein
VTGVDQKPTMPQKKLVYKEYKGPYRENLRSWPKWNVFPIWREECPRALEAVEVFSFGRRMWMLLQQVSGEEIEDCSGEIVVTWNKDAGDIWQRWKDFVQRCLEVDPNQRIRLSQLVDFWVDAEKVSLSMHKSGKCSFKSSCPVMLATMHATLTRGLAGPRSFGKSLCEKGQKESRAE